MKSTEPPKFGSGPTVLKGSPAAVYRFLADLVRQKMIYPFQLDYQLHARLPSVDELRSAVDEHAFDETLGGRRSFRLLKSAADERD